MALDVLITLFVYVLCAALCIAGLVVRYARPILATFDRLFKSYDGLSLDEVLAIEEARSELASLARARAEKARQSATVARFDALSALAFYLPTWVAPWESEACKRLARATIADLCMMPGVGPQRSRRLVDQGDALTGEMVRRILTRDVGERVLRSV
jgi:hypothetical protein